jgi:hypothetical protein
LSYNFVEPKEPVQKSLLAGEWAFGYYLSLFYYGDINAGMQDC